MSLLAMCMPILPGKKEAWLEAVKQLNSPEAKPAADSIRENAGVHERAFLQKHQMETLLYLHMKAKIQWRVLER